MSFSALTNEVRSSSQRSSREGAAIDHIILHHSAATNAEVVLDMMTSGSRQVSSNYVIGNDGTIYGVVDEEDRAWTSGSPDDGGKGASWDRRSITFECLDIDTNWDISDASYRSIAAVMADCAARYGFQLVRAGSSSSVFGHKELWDYFEASYPTACPGGMDVDRVTNDAATILAGGGLAANDQEDDMNDYLCVENSKDGMIGKGQRFVQGADGVLRCLPNGEWEVRSHNFPAIKPAEWSGDRISAAIKNVGLREYTYDKSTPGGVGRMTGKIIYSAAEPRVFPKMTVAE